ncbi:MAG: N-6 DNA methylase [Bacteroidales bacterium]|nr:N-6 DNA methylase [Bacteroidales bacterium]
MNELNDISSWKKQLGLLPINLFSSEQKNKYILLNGGYGDFCIDFDSNKNQNDYYSYAWSSNTKNFLTLNNDNVSLYNWLKDKKESYKLTLIQNNLPKFYDYLLKDSYKTEYDIVPYIIDIYRSLRNLTGEAKEGIQAINQLLLLLIAYQENTCLKDIDFTKWNISNFERVAGLENYLDRLKNINYKNLELNVDLLLRHTAGQLFQEAQKEAIFYNRNQDLFGFYDSKYDSNYQLYSSFHYTPSFLARSIVEYSISKLNVLEKPMLKILDPACGSSEFLLEFLKQLKSLGYTGSVIINGLDKSESAINISNFLLSYEKREWGDSLSINLQKVNNSLTEDWENDYDLILMNPPFLSWELMSKDDREIVSSVLGNESKRKPNIASAFIFKSIQSLKETGIIGTVMPSSILLMDSYQKLRNEIKDTLSLLLIGKLGNFVFEHALTDVSILIGQKPKSVINPLLLWTKNEKGMIANAFRDLRKVNYEILPYVKENKSHNIYVPDEYPEKDNWKINSYAELELKKHLDELILLKKLKPVQYIFNVKQGIRTGNNKVFKISIDIYNSLPKEERNFFRPSIDNDSIKNGFLSIVNYTWFPYSNKCNILISSENELVKKAPYFYKNILLQNKNSLVNRKKKIPYWWSLSDFAPRLLPISVKLVSTEFGKSGSFAFDEKGEFVIERGNGWIPKKEFKNKDYYYFYLSIFNSSFFNELLAIYSKELLKGWDLGKKYTANIPIPEITEELENSFIFEKLVHFGKQINEGNINYFGVIDEYIKSSIYEL